MDCIHCGTFVHPERVALGKTWCMSSKCIDLHHQEWKEDYRYILVPKQGYTLVRADSPDLKSGKSSGRT